MVGGSRYRFVDRCAGTHVGAGTARLSATLHRLLDCDLADNFGGAAIGKTRSGEPAAPRKKIGTERCERCNRSAVGLKRKGGSGELLGDLVRRMPDRDSVVRRVLQQIQRRGF